MKIKKAFLFSVSLLLFGDCFGISGDIKDSAHLRTGESCGFTRSGNQMFVVNDRKDKQIRVTVRITARQGIEESKSQKVFQIPAGGESNLGCSASGDIPVTRYTYEIVGCEVL